MDLTIIHHNYRVWSREGLHSIESLVDKLVKFCGVEGPLNYVTMEYSFVE